MPRPYKAPMRIMKKILCIIFKKTYSLNKIKHQRQAVSGEYPDLDAAQCSALINKVNFQTHAGLRSSAGVYRSAAM